MDYTGNREQMLLTTIGAALARRKTLEVIGEEICEVPSRILNRAGDDLEEARRKLNEYAEEQKRPGR